jgi:hypothetical protein
VFADLYFDKAKSDPKRGPATKLHKKRSGCSSFVCVRKTDKVRGRERGGARERERKREREREREGEKERERESRE